jgi:hypothetical protein
MTPDAGKGAAFEKDSRADAGPIFAAIPLNIKNKPF